MTTNFNDSHMTSIAQLKEFVKLTKAIEFQGTTKKGKYRWLENILNVSNTLSYKKRQIYC